MRRRSEPKRRHHSGVPVDVALQRRFWRTEAVRHGCAMCRHFPLPVGHPDLHVFFADLQFMEGHHVLPKALLKREGFPGKLWDARNALGLCRYHHARHENYVQRVPRDVVPNDAFDFADELGLGWAIDREYP